MIKKGNIGPWFFWGLAFLVIPLWVFSIRGIVFVHNKNFYLTNFSEISALIGFALYALSFALSARIKWLEKYFGGLHKMYQTHHKMAKVAFFLLLLHPIFLALLWVPQNMLKAISYFFPIHQRLAVNFGSLALWGLIILMYLTLIARLPYHKWKISHKLMGLFFIFGVLHVFLMKSGVVNTLYLFIYFVFLTLTGITAFLYKTILFDFLSTHYLYRVEQINKTSANLMEITLAPHNVRLQFIPGQYFFFSFIGPHFTRESHPFTICSSPEHMKIQVIVRAVGDFTKNLYHNLKPNTMVLLEGPYGHFNCSNYKKEQIWISGDIGVIPFMSWIRSMKTSQPERIIDFYYCVNTENEAVYYNEIKKIEDSNSKFHIYLICTNKQGFLKAAEIPYIRNKEIFICGPKAMRFALIRQLHALKIPKNQIHYEDFDFF